MKQIPGQIRIFGRETKKYMAAAGPASVKIVYTGGAAGARMEDVTMIVGPKRIRMTGRIRQKRRGRDGATGAKTRRIGIGEESFIQRIFADILKNIRDRS